MATVKPRITITLEEDQYVVLQQLSRLKGVSMSKLVVEFLDPVFPPMQRLTESMNRIKKSDALLKGQMSIIAEDIDSAFEPTIQEVIDDYKKLLSKLESVSGGTLNRSGDTGEPE